MTGGNLDMGKTDRISGLFWLIFSLFFSYSAYKLGMGSLRQPGPGFVFFWAGIVVALLSLSVIVKSFGTRATDEEKESIFGKSNVPKVCFVLISLFLYALLMEQLGFLIVTLLLFLFLLGVIEKKRWVFAVLVSFAVTVIAYLVFEVGLQSQLPKGVLEFLRF
jgi:putative tricarboxylic transport membrane protein